MNGAELMDGLIGSRATRIVQAYCWTGPPILVFDTETTGVSKKDVVIQLGYILFDATGSRIDAYERLWRTTRPSNRFALRIHKIPDADVRTAEFSAETEFKRFADTLRRVTESGGTAVAHNAKFDIRMLNQTAAVHDLDTSLDAKSVFCTMSGLRQRSVKERGQSCKNGAAYTYLGGSPLGTMHTALVDSEATAYIYFEGRRRNWWP